MSVHLSAASCIEWVARIYCFHDVDAMADANSVAEHRKFFAEAVDQLERLQSSSGRKLQWRIANAFSHPR